MTEYVRSNTWISASSGEEALMMRMSDGLFQGLNSSGTVLWELLETPQSVQTLIHSLSDTFQLPKQSVEPDVKAFLSELIESGAVVLHDQD